MVSLPQCFTVEQNYPKDWELNVIERDCPLIKELIVKMLNRGLSLYTLHVRTARGNSISAPVKVLRPAGRKFNDDDLRRMSSCAQLQMPVQNKCDAHRT